MTGLAVATRLDLVNQRRSGILVAVMVVTALWALGLAAAAAGVRARLAVLAVYLDAGIVGFVFAGGQVLLERRDGTLRALGTSPQTGRAYVTARLATLTALGVGASLVLAAAAGQLGARSGALAAGVVLLSVPVLAASLTVAAHVPEVTGFLLRAQLVISPAVLPLTGHLGWVPRPVAAVVPTDAGLALVEYALHDGAVDPWRLLVGVPYALLASVWLVARAARAVEDHLFRGATS